MDMICAQDKENAGYERLLLERDALRKEAAGCKTLYLREFGALITKLYRKKIDCIAKKKSIAYCQADVNHGRPVDAAGLQQFLAGEMEEYRRGLDRILAECDASAKAGFVTEYTAAQVKSLYHRLARQIHPDLNPTLAGRPEFAELWARITQAYEGNDLRELQELEVLVHRALAQVQAGAAPLHIPDLAAREARLRSEMEQIRSTDPYQYKFLLADDDAVAAKKQELQQEYDSFDAYGRQLDAVLQGLLLKGVVVPWQEN